MRELINKIKAKLNTVNWKNWDRRKIGAGVIGMALVLIALSVWNLTRQGYIGNSEPETPNAETPVATLRHPLTGALVESAVAQPFVYAVMVENSADAWPQAGVDQAFLVVEVPAEGGIPRFLAFYGADQDVEKIGPVRSARPYCIDFAAAFGALYAHVGGSPAAMEILQLGKLVLNFDEFSNQYQFWRSPDRFAPHNVFTSTDLLATGLERRYPEALAAEPAYSFWKFKDDLALESRPDTVSDFIINMGASIYRVTWVYDRETNTYRRMENTHDHVMEDGAQLTANNIIIMETEMEVLDAIGRLSVRTSGEGKALVIQDGLVKEATWKKTAITDQVRFYDAEGNELSMNAGQTWMEVIEELDQVTR